jgi:predicted regulator of Ras-like GTPase activity (Roadblock/LC7/MglB family)
MPDEISRLSAEVARDPSGTAWILLADAFRRAGRIEDAERVALRGLERHPYLPDGHDALARVRVEQGNDVSASDEWQMALRLDARHLASVKGLAFLAHRRGDVAAAERFLRTAAALAPNDARIAAAHRKAVSALQASSSPANAAADHSPFAVPHPSRPSLDRESAPLAPSARPAPLGDEVRLPSRESMRPPSSGPRELFADIEALGGASALLVDRDGLVLAGRARDGAGADASDVLGAELSGLGEESARALSQLGLGEWDRVIVECVGATIAFAPARDGAVVMLATPAEIPLGLARVLLDRTRCRADGWLEAL